MPRGGIACKRGRAGCNPPNNLWYAEGLSLAGVIRPVWLAVTGAEDYSTLIYTPNWLTYYEKTPMKHHTIKSRFALFVAACSVLVAGAASAMQNEPRDFNGLVWGSSIDDHKASLTLVSADEHLAHYRRTSVAAVFGGVDAWRISYKFYKNRFSGGTVIFVGTRNLSSMLAHLNSAYGPAQSANPRHHIYVWEGERASVMLSCDISISCYVEFFDNALRESELAEVGERSNRATRDD